MVREGTNGGTLEDGTRTDHAPLLPGWQDLAESVAQALTDGRRGAHPHATLTEMETAVYAAMQRLPARALDQVVHASALADVSAHPAVPRPPCPECGGALPPRGRKTRTVRPARQRAPLDLKRTYAVCSACGAGLFPPG